MNAPLRNSIRSFWIPEASSDAEFLRLVRRDKAAVIAVGVAATYCVGVFLTLIATLTFA